MSDLKPTFSLRALLVVTVIACASFAALRYPRGALWMSATRTIQPGMTKEEVTSVIGPPTIGGAFHAETLWTYRTGLFSYWYFLVRFDSQGRVAGTRVAPSGSFKVPRDAVWDR